MVTTKSTIGCTHLVAPKPGGALSESSEPAGQELLYATRVSLDGRQMQVEDRMVNLAPGMAATVEIKTGQRRIIEYMLSPCFGTNRKA